MCQPILRGLAAICLFTAAVSARAVPIVSIDMDLVTAGVQSSATIDVGNALTVGVFVTDVDFPGLAGYAVTMGFDGALVAATGTGEGDFLMSPVVNLLELLLPGSARRDSISLLPVIGATGDGLLATISLAGLAVGTSVLSISDLTLSPPGGGTAVSPVSVSGASLTVQAPVAVPAPASALLLLFGLAAVGIRRLRRV